MSLPRSLMLSFGLAASSASAQQADRMKPVCQLIATGGTIAMKLDPATRAPVPALSGSDLVASVPELADVATIRVESVSNIPSFYMEPERWRALHAAVDRAIAQEDVTGVVVTHGTDTMEETAYFLDLTVSSEKPIILIGAQRNASERDFDGARNLVNAARICIDRDARGKGVMIAMNDHINAARDATKTSTTNVETFRSGDFGFLGVVDADRVIFARSPTRRQHLPLLDAPLPRVDIVSTYAGADGALLQAAVAAGARGIVLEALGMGNVPLAVFESTREAIRRGVVVVISTRVPNGRVQPVYGPPGGGRTLKDAGAVFADDLSPQKARALLMLALQRTSSPTEMQRLFDR